MAENLTQYALAFAGLIVILLSCVVLAVRNKGEQTVSWKGFGVTFEIKPCGDCPNKKLKLQRK